MKIQFIANIKGIYLGYTFDQSAVITIGREIGNTIAPINVDGFSRHHARIFFRDGDWYVEDLGSTNGTYRNRVKIEAPEKIEKGDSIRCGLMEIASFDFQAGDPIAPMTAADAAAPKPIPAVAPTVVKLVEPHRPNTPSLLTPRKTELTPKPVAPVEPIKPAEVAKPVSPLSPIAPAKPEPKPAPVKPLAPVEELKPVEPLPPVEELTPVAELTPLEELTPVEELKPVDEAKPAAPAGAPRPGGTALRRPTLPGSKGGLKPGLKLPTKPGAMPTGLKLPPKGSIPTGLKLPPKPGMKSGLKLPTKPA